jgi:hypothetical protein
MGVAIHSMYLGEHCLGAPVPRLAVVAPHRMPRVRYTDQHLQEEQAMISAPSRRTDTLGDRTCTEHWIVRDPEGNFWIVPFALS